MIDDTNRDDYDSPWKEALERYFPDFLALLFPRIHAAIDWSKGYAFLDKELQQVVRDAEHGRRHADKLAQVLHPRGHSKAVPRAGLEQEFERELIAHEEQANMPYITSIERLGRQEGQADLLISM